jgi:hypothetical protein
MRKHRKKIPKHSNIVVQYSIGTKCTWKEKLPKMNNNRYLLLYGIAPHITNITLTDFKRLYKARPFELSKDIKYIQKNGSSLQNKAEQNTKELSINRDYIGIIIDTSKASVLNTSDIADIIIKNHVIKNHKDEINLIRNYCLKNKYDVFVFQPSYSQINKNLYTMKLQRPQLYVIVNMNIIIDVAIGENNINQMKSKFEARLDRESKEAKPSNKQNIRDIQVKDVKDLFNYYSHKH